MKIGCFTVLFGNKQLKEVLPTIKQFGCEMIELGTGNYPGNYHCNPEKLLNDSNSLKMFKKIISDNELEISALSCHGNPIHPDKTIAKQHLKIHEKTIELASKLEIKVVNCFSGCPGAEQNSKTPSWNIIAWPPEYLKSLKWQWDSILVPFWQKQALFAEKHNVKIAFELHPGFCIYNTNTLLRIRELCGKNIGVNLDPSHLFWQGMDPLRVIRQLKDSIFHVHAKDCHIDPQNTSLNGVLDATPYTDEINRSWIFRTIGYGHDIKWWKDFVSELRLVAYDYVLSIEHEDSLMDTMEGLKKAIATLREILLVKKPNKAFWA